MSYAQTPRSPLANAPALAAVALLHLVILAAILSNTGTSSPSPAPTRSTAQILPDITPPPPPPPSLAVPLQPPAVADFVPQPVVPVLPPPTTTDAISRTSAVPQPAQPHAAQPAPADAPFLPSAVLRGAASPAYPDAYLDRSAAGEVTVTCTIEVDGNPTGCQVLSSTGGSAFASETLRWLTSANHPVYRPALRGGVPQREAHKWTVHFQAPE